MAGVIGLLRPRDTQMQARLASHLHWRPNVLVYDLECRDTTPPESDPLERRHRKAIRLTIGSSSDNLAQASRKHTQPYGSFIEINCFRCYRHGTSLPGSRERTRK